MISVDADKTSGLGQGRRSLQHQPHLSCSDSNAVEAIVPAARAVSSVAGTEISWVLVAGNGTIDSLWWSQTPLTCAQAVCPGGDLPMVNLSWDQTHEVAEAVDARVPTLAEWEFMAAGPQRRRFPWGSQPWTPDRANLRGSGYGRRVAVGQFPLGATPNGLLDVAGNVWEWTADQVHGNATVVGGSYHSLPTYARCGYRNEVPTSLISPGIGVRVVRQP